MDVDMNTIVGVPTMDYFNNNMMNPLVISVLALVIILYYILFASLGTNGVTSSTGNTGSSSIEILLWSLFLVLVIINGMNYLFNVNIITSIKNIFSGTPEIDIVVDKDLDGDDIRGTSTVPEIKFTEQVYHIPGNEYTYDDAKAICKAYGNRLANYKEIEKAFEDGGDWCSYGWSADQMALFPTQYDKWAELQKIPGHKQDCGRPGINGGYIANPNVRFGINCYGYKPKITNIEAEMMEKSPLYPKTQKEIDFEKRVDYWKTKIGEILVSPFNSKNWSSM